MTWTAFVAYGDTSNPTWFVIVLNNGMTWQPASVTVSATITVSAGGPR